MDVGVFPWCGGYEPMDSMVFLNFSDILLL